MAAAIIDLLVLIGVGVLWFTIVRDWLRRRDRPEGPALSSSLEHRLLRVAKAAGGEVTATAVALALEVSLEEAQAALQQLCSQGYAEMEVAEDGVVLYRFPELLHVQSAASPRLPETLEEDDENSLRHR